MSLHQPPPRSASLTVRFNAIRAHSMGLVDGLSAEDCQLQSMPDASPIKWHLAHTSWFFETFLLAESRRPPPPFDPAFKVLFNSYYIGVGERHLRAERGLLSRPGLEQVLQYRQHVDQHMLALLAEPNLGDRELDLFELGLQHEQQHQELILTDVKHHFSCNPLESAWR
ncbi:MAG: DinB family protein, partial [Halopseudomonas sp.]